MKTLRLPLLIALSMLLTSCSTNYVEITSNTTNKYYGYNLYDENIQQEIRDQIIKNTGFYEKEFKGYKVYINCNPENVGENSFGGGTIPLLSEEDKKNPDIVYDADEDRYLKAEYNYILHRDYGWNVDDTGYAGITNAAEYEYEDEYIAEKIPNIMNTNSVIKNAILNTGSSQEYKIYQEIPLSAVGISEKSMVSNNIIYFEYPLYNDNGENYSLQSNIDIINGTRRLIVKNREQNCNAIFNLLVDNGYDNSNIVNCYFGAPFVLWEYEPYKSDCIAIYPVNYISNKKNNSIQLLGYVGYRSNSYINGEAIEVIDKPFIEVDCIGLEDFNKTNMLLSDNNGSMQIYWLLKVRSIDFGSSEIQLDLDLYYDLIAGTTKTDSYGLFIDPTYPLSQSIICNIGQLYQQNLQRMVKDNNIGYVGKLNTEAIE